mgnify:CR=1 FL=1
MTPDTSGLADVAGITHAQRVVTLPCATLEPTLSFFTGRLGFRVDAIFPAEDPRQAFISGHGLALRVLGAAVERPADEQCGLLPPPGLEPGIHRRISLDE